MSVDGKINLVTDPSAFFAPIILGGGPPSAGFQGWQGSLFVVTTTGFATLPGFFTIPFDLGSVFSRDDGTFTLPDVPAALAGFNIDQISITLSQFGVQVYRSGVFPLQDAGGGLDIFLFQPSLPQSAGISAGQVSTALSNEGLPGNTMLTASSSGLGVAGSESEASIQFGVQVVPDTSTNLDVFFDLTLSNWDINVGWPESWCESAGDILNAIRSGLQTAGSGANQLVLNNLTAIITGPPFSLTAGEAQALLDKVSIQFTSVSFPNQLSWALSDQNEDTIVIFAQPIIGFPRGG